MGNQSGPMQPCRRTFFIYAATALNAGIGWEQNTKTIIEPTKIEVTVATN